MNQPTPQKPQQNVVTLDEQQHHNQSMIAVEQSKAVQTVQASLVIAKRFPRDEVRAQEKIMNACMRPGLAEVATFTYARGGTNITGASIRLAEALAQYWGNIEFGWRELDRKPGESTVQAYCWDKETNVQREQTFAVKHVRDTRGGGKALTDERDIYENNANMAARRMRACILAMIPGDVVEDALTQCEKTMATKVELTPERIKNMLDLFSGFGVNKGMLEERLQRKIDAITPAQFISLGKIANSLKDGMSEAKDWFNMELVAKEEEKKTASAAAEGKKKPAEAKEEEKGQLEGFKEKQQGKVKPTPTPAEKKKTVDELYDDEGRPLDNGQGDKEPD